jgi:tubulin-folding cofactor B
MPSPFLRSGIIKNREMLELKSYVQSHDSVQYQGMAQGTISIDLTHSNLIQKHIEIRFDLHETVGDLKYKIYRQTGTPSQFQTLTIRSGGANMQTMGPNDNLKLGYYGIESGMEIHCVDSNQHSGSARGGYEDVSKIKKYKMSEEEYEVRKGTLRDWAKKQKR